MQIDPAVTTIRGNEIISCRPIFEPRETLTATKGVLRTIPKPPPTFPVGIQVPIGDQVGHIKFDNDFPRTAVER
jgi:hypothetical protein